MQLATVYTVSLCNFSVATLCHYGATVYTVSLCSYSVHCVTMELQCTPCHYIICSYSVHCVTMQLQCTLCNYVASYSVVHCVTGCTVIVCALQQFFQLVRYIVSLCAMQQLHSITECTTVAACMVTQSTLQLQSDMVQLHCSQLHSYTSYILQCHLYNYLLYVASQLYSCQMLHMVTLQFMRACCTVATQLVTLQLCTPQVIQLVRANCIMTLHVLVHYSQYTQCHCIATQYSQPYSSFCSWLAIYPASITQQLAVMYLAGYSSYIAI